MTKIVYVKQADDKVETKFLDKFSLFYDDKIMHVK